MSRVPAVGQAVYYFTVVDSRGELKADLVSTVVERVSAKKVGLRTYLKMILPNGAGKLVHTFRTEVTRDAYATLPASPDEAVAVWITAQEQDLAEHRAWIAQAEQALAVAKNFSGESQ